MTSNKTNTLIIFAGDKPWFSTGSNNVKHKSVGKGNVTKKSVMKSRASSRINAPPIHPIFLAISRLVDDPFWKQTFERGSTGKFPRGFQFNNLMLTYKIRNKIFKCSLEGLSDDQCHETVYNFMSSQAGILSEIDKRRNDQELRTLLSNITENVTESWSKIDAKQKKLCISRYVSCLKDELNLNNEEKIQLYKTLIIALCLKQIANTAIHLKHGKIVKIDGLSRMETGQFHIIPTITETENKIRRKVELENEENPKIKHCSLNFMKKLGKHIETTINKRSGTILKKSPGVISNSFDEDESPNDDSQ